MQSSDLGLLLEPDVAVTITNSDLAMLYASRAPEIAHALGKVRLADATTACVYRHHSTHWLAFVLEQGHPVPSENGLALVCAPKRRTSYDQFLALIRRSLGDLLHEIITPSPEA